MSNNGLKTSSITHITIKNEQPCKYYVYQIMSNLIIEKMNITYNVLCKSNLNNGYFLYCVGIST